MIDLRAGDTVQPRTRPHTIGIVRDPAYRHRYTNFDGEADEREGVLVEWPDDEWMAVVSAADLLRVHQGQSDA